MKEEYADMYAKKKRIYIFFFFQLTSISFFLPFLPNVI